MPTTTTHLHPGRGRRHGEFRCSKAPIMAAEQTARRARRVRRRRSIPLHACFHQCDGHGGGEQAAGARRPCPAPLSHLGRRSILFVAGPPERIRQTAFRAGGAPALTVKDNVGKRNRSAGRTPAHAPGGHLLPTGNACVSAFCVRVTVYNNAVASAGFTLSQRVITHPSCQSRIFLNPWHHESR